MKVCCFMCQVWSLMRSLSLMHRKVKVFCPRRIYVYAIVTVCLLEVFRAFSDIHFWPAAEKKTYCLSFSARLYIFLKPIILLQEILYRSFCIRLIVGNEMTKWKTKCYAFRPLKGILRIMFSIDLCMNGERNTTNVGYNSTWKLRDN